MEKKNRYLLYSIFYASLLLVAIGIYTYGYNPPTCNPPGCNLPAPINAGPDSQTKAGNLTIQGNLTTGGLTMSAGAGANKVLTTDASGVATWQTAAGGSPGGSTGYVQFASSTSFAGDSNIFWDNTNKRLGIRTTAPAGPLHVKGTSAFSATGGTITYSGGYTIHTFTTSGTFTPNSTNNVLALVVAGGGAGGELRTGGGGGAGGMIYNASFGVTAQVYTITVGNGGAVGSNGSNSVFSTLTAIGGGRGGIDGANTPIGQGYNGGSGGGARSNTTPAVGGTGITGQGYAGEQISPGARGGGGGGAGEIGGTDTSGEGGDGLACSISGSSVTYAGGGGGGNISLENIAGGSGGGGTGANINNIGSTAGTANTGGGGGGGGGTSGGKAGGSGIVIISYPTLATVDSLVVNSTGDVGIGTASPGAKLDVVGSIRVNQTRWPGLFSRYLELWSQACPAPASCDTCCGTGYCLGGYYDDSRKEKVSCSYTAYNHNCICIGLP